MISRYRPVTRCALVAELADRLAATPGTLRVGVDGAPCTEPHEMADALVEPLRELGRPAPRVSARDFWHDASLRLEHGREDIQSYLSWLDAAAVRREVLEPVLRDGHYLPSLRDPATNRAARTDPIAAPGGTVLIIDGTFLLGAGLPFELTVHLAMSAPALARHTPAADSWTLAAFAEYERTVAPIERADVVVRVDDPRHPAVRVNTEPG